VVIADEFDLDDLLWDLVTSEVIVSRWINLWWKYPFTTAVRYLERTDVEITGVALRIGPLAFMICWGNKKFPLHTPKPKLYKEFPSATENN